jgi:hypothetical protein
MYQFSIEVVYKRFFWISWWGTTPEVSGWEQEAQSGPVLGATGNLGELFGSI